MIVYAISVFIDSRCFVVEGDCFVYFIKYIMIKKNHAKFIGNRKFYLLIFRDKYRVFMELFNMGAYLIPEEYKKGKKPYSVP